MDSEAPRKLFFKNVGVLHFHPIRGAATPSGAPLHARLLLKDTSTTFAPPRTTFSLRICSSPQSPLDVPPWPEGREASWSDCSEAASEPIQLLWGTEAPPL